MLEKLTTHDIQDVSALFSLADKCARAVEGHAWHSPAAQETKGESTTPSAEGQAQGGGDGNGDNNKKKAGGNQSLAGAPIAAAAAAGGGRGGKCPRQPSNSDDGSTKCPVHNSTRHTRAECREIKKLVE
jgi:hypothetical protein